MVSDVARAPEIGGLLRGGGAGIFGTKRRLDEREKVVKQEGRVVKKRIPRLLFDHPHKILQKYLNGFEKIPRPVPTSPALVCAPCG